MELSKTLKKIEKDKKIRVFVNTNFNFYLKKDRNIIDNLIDYIEKEYKIILSRQVLKKFLFGGDIICPICKKDVVKQDLTRVTETCCKNNCKYDLIALKNIKKYGVSNVSQVEEIKKKKIETYKKHYGASHFAKSEEYTYRRSDIINKAKKTHKKKYGVEHYTQLKECRERIQETSLRRYGAKNYSQSKVRKSKASSIENKKKETCLLKYNKCNYFQTEEFKQRRYLSLKKNNSFHISKPEKKLLNILNLFFDDVKYQYRSKEYPFNCDFYIPSLDLYIEFQGTWLHGKEPYNKKNKEHKKKLKLWKERSEKSKFYKIAIHTWTKRDTKKRKVAKKNGLNYLEFFNYSDMVKYIVYNLDW